MGIDESSNRVIEDKLKSGIKRFVIRAFVLFVAFVVQQSGTRKKILR